jgi:hypothetical protein
VSWSRSASAAAQPVDAPAARNARAGPIGAHRVYLEHGRDPDVFAYAGDVAPGDLPDPCTDTYARRYARRPHPDRAARAPDARRAKRCGRCSQALISPEQFDVAVWLPSLRAESGPAPQDVGGGIDPGVVALVAGFFASRAGLAVIPAAPRVRHVQRVHLRSPSLGRQRSSGFPPWTVHASNW